MSGMNQVLASLLSMVICASVGTGAQQPEDGPRKLTVHPARPLAGAKELLLLPKPEEMTDADAFPLYEKAIKSLPKELDWDKIKGWRQIPVSQLPQEEVGSVLRQFDAVVPLLEQAGTCKRCDWPVFAEDESPVSLSACRSLVFLLAVKARSELSRHDGASCGRTLRTGLALARHLNEGPTVIHLLVGVAVGAIVCAEIEQYVQQPGAPSLEAAIRTLPKPLFDEKHSDLYGMDAEGRARAQLLVERANRHVIALQYIETLRLYATKTGKWPQTLDELKTSLPNDPVAGKPFAYKRLSDTQVMLEGPMAPGGSAKDQITYELTLAK